MNESELSTFKEKLGNYIHLKRTGKELSTRVFVLLTDVERHQLINIEGRVDIRLSTMIKIFKALG